jgi:hypothetical protein
MSSESNDARPTSGLSARWRRIGFLSFALAVQPTAIAAGPAADQEDATQALLAKQQSMLGIGQRSCRSDEEEIMVCGRRDPNRHRVPPIESTRRADSAPADRDRLLQPTCADIGGRGCGPKLIRISTVTADGVKVGIRKPAPNLANWRRERWRVYRLRYVAKVSGHSRSRKTTASEESTSLQPTTEPRSCYEL